jgi:hypothetical protein
MLVQQRRRFGSPPVRSESQLAFSKRPSYLKRQKEQQRLARAAEKRDARRARKNAKDLPVNDGEGEPADDLAMGAEGDQGSDTADAEGDSGAEESAAK